MKSRSEFLSELIEKYPRTFKLLKQPIKEGEPFHPICFGVEVGRGWWPLVEELAAKFESLPDDVTAQQIKEKFGELRFYVIGSDAAYAIEEDGCNRSRTICEGCGAPGSIRQHGGWLATLCEGCLTKWMEAGHLQDIVS